MVISRNSAIGRFWQIDPLAETYVYNSTYAFAENKVIANFELEGLEAISIHSASFAPFNKFGKAMGTGSFSGDGNNRKFGTNPNASSRIYGRADLNLSGDGITLTGSDQRGSVSRNYGSGKEEYSSASMQPSISKQDSDGLTASAMLDYDLSGSNKAAPGGIAPDIDVKGNMSFGVMDLGDQGSMAIISGMIAGDKFPASETFLTDSNGLGVFLGVSGADGGPVTMLPGDNHRAMASFTIGVSFNSDGHITGVMHNEKTYTVADWNKQFSNLNPQNGNVTTNFD